MRRSLAWSVLGLGLFLMSAGCTRKVDTNKFNVRIPVPQKVGSLIAYNLDIAIVNVHIPGQPTRIVKRENHEQNKAKIGRAHV